MSSLPGELKHASARVVRRKLVGKHQTFTVNALYVGLLPINDSLDQTFSDAGRKLKASGKVTNIGWPVC